MSVSLVWFAVQGVAGEELLDRAGFVDTGEADEFFEAEVSGCAHPGGWYVLMAEDLDLMDVENLRDWSEGARLVAVAVQEEARFSLATEWREGRQVWSVSHAADDDGEAVVALEGETPEAFEAVRREFLETGDDEAAFMAPVELAWRITGFRHDTLGFDEAGAVFTVLAEG